MANNKNQNYNDLGLDTRSQPDGYRALNKDGSFNVLKKNVSFFERLNTFHSLVSMSWMKFFTVILIVYFSINLLFATLYLSVGLEHLTGIAGKTLSDKFIEAFFFSAQTITTLGYGRVAPIGTLANIVAAAESMLGLLTFALGTGLMYGRFSKPTATIKYSNYAVMAPYQDINGFMFKVVNPKKNQLVEVEVNLTLSMRRMDSETRDFFTLDVEREKVVFFPTMWTIVHPVNDSSPLQGISQADLINRDAEFIVMIKAFDESFSQTVYSRSSYKAEEIKWGEKFAYLTERKGNGLVIDVSRIDETYKTDLN
ncbi:MAG: ion channel [Christiangramia sp.]